MNKRHRRLLCVTVSQDDPEVVTYISKMGYDGAEIKGLAEKLYKI